MSVGGKEMFVLVKVKANSYFRRHGDDVHTDATISMAQAVLGGSTRIQGIYEDNTVKVKLQLNIFAIFSSLYAKKDNWIILLQLRSYHL